LGFSTTVTFIQEVKYNFHPDKVKTGVCVDLGYNTKKQPAINWLNKF